MPRESVPRSEVLDVSTYPREVLAETARELRVIVDGWPETRRGLPRYRWMCAQLEVLDAAVARDPE